MKHQPNEQGTTRLFKNPILEKLARTHISIPLSIYFAGSAILVYVSLNRGYTNVLETIGIFFIGFVLWTYVEYLAHKHIFHMIPDTKLKEKLQYTFHGVHHEYPRDKSRIAMPPAASLIILTALFFLFKLVIGNYVYTFLPGFIMGYSAYLFVHYMVHAILPPKNILNVLWIHHSIHHYKDDTVAFGVSSPFWDYVMGTLPKKTYKRSKRNSNKKTGPEEHAEFAA